MKRLARLVLVAAFVAGCATGGEYTKGPVVSAKELPRTIAVLPLIPPSDPDKEEPARVVTRMIYGSLSATPYDVLKPQIVEERLVRAGLGDPRAAQAKEPAELAKILKVDGIVYGELTHWNRIFLGAYAQVAAGAHVKLVDARNGTILFERKEVSRSHEGGVPDNPISAAIQLVRSALKLREIELIRASDDLVRDLLKGVPTPPPGEARRPPAFAHVLSDGAGRLLKIGDVVTVIALGQPGVIGSFDVQPMAKNLALEETGEGVYVGRYTVKPGDNATDAFVVARLADGAGRTSEREDVLGRFHVDTVPPETPKGLSVSLKEKTLQLSWGRGTEPDLAAYRVYRSGSALTGFALVATTETPVFSDALEGIAYYRVAAVDKAGNESAPSPPVALSLLASPLKGTIASEKYLVPAHSPYTVQGSLIVDGGATLTILPGVVVRFEPGSDGIIVKDGTLVARGSPGQRIIFTSGSERPRPGDFSAAVVIRAKAGQTSALEEVVMEHAGVALRVESGGAEVLRAEVARNLQSGVEVGGTGVLKLAESRVTGHASGSGVTIQGFGRAVLRGNHISENGWAVVNYSGNQVDARENWWGTGAPPDGLFVGDVDRRSPLASGAPPK